MDRISRLGTWLHETLDLGAEHASFEYLRRALWIVLAFASAILAIWWVGSMKGSALWTIPPFLGLVIATANGLWPLKNAIQSFNIGGFDAVSNTIALPFVVLFAVIIPCALAILSPVILIWNLIQALRVAIR